MYGPTLYQMRADTSTCCLPVGAYIVTFHQINVVFARCVCERNRCELSSIYWVVLTEYCWFLSEIDIFQWIIRIVFFFVVAVVE